MGHAHTTASTQLVSIAAYTNASDGVLDATVGVASAIAAAIADGSFLVNTGIESDRWLVTSYVNPYGVEFCGAGKILIAYSDIYGSGHRQVNSRSDLHKDVIGREYLYAFHSRLIANQGGKIVFSGDSTTVGNNLTAPYMMPAAMSSFATKYGISGVTTVNRGFSGKNTGHWVNDYLASDLLLAPDLYVIRWGINDYLGYPSNSTPLTYKQTVDNIRYGLALCRTTKAMADMSIILMMPNATEYSGQHASDNGNEQRYEAILRGFRQAARDYGACFIDTYSLLRDANTGRGTYFDSYATHPGNTFALNLNSLLADVIYPSMLRGAG